MFLIFYVFTLEILMPVATHGHDPSLVKKVQIRQFTECK
jgi:hypothetical protein